MNAHVKTPDEVRAAVARLGTMLAVAEAWGAEYYRVRAVMAGRQKTLWLRPPPDHEIETRLRAGMFWRDIRDELGVSFSRISAVVEAAGLPRRSRAKERMIIASLLDALDQAVSDGDMHADVARTERAALRQLIRDRRAA